MLVLSKKKVVFRSLPVRVFASSFVTHPSVSLHPSNTASTPPPSPRYSPHRRSTTTTTLLLRLQPSTELIGKFCRRRQPLVLPQVRAAGQRGRGPALRTIPCRRPPSPSSSRRPPPPPRHSPTVHLTTETYLKPSNPILDLGRETTDLTCNMLFFFPCA